jgi:oligopeptide transport system permease protein
VPRWTRDCDAHHDLQQRTAAKELGLSLQSLPTLAALIRPGTLPGGRPLARLLRGPAARIGLAVCVTMALLAQAAPWISAFVLGLSPNEQHLSASFAPPGTRVVGRDHPAYDGDATAFRQVDLDGDGLLRCRVVPDPTLSASPQAARDLLGRVLGPQGATWSVASRVPLQAVMAAFAGEVHCPELDRLVPAERFYAFLLDDFDRGAGRTPPDPAAPAPDGALNVHEYPNKIESFTDPVTARAVQDLRLLGPAAFARLDADGDGLATRDEIALATRASLFEAADLLHRHDDNGDLSISPAEFPGLPRLRTYWLGADQKGRDVLARLLHGSRVSLGVGLLAALVALVLGVSYGALAGIAGRRWDGLLMRVLDVLYGLPFLFVIVLLLVLFGRSTLHLFLALGALSWLSMARLVRAQVRSLREQPFVQAAVAAGIGPARILWRHILPHAWGPILAFALLGIPAIVLEEAFLSYLGLGVQSPQASWGTLIAEGTRVMTLRPWLLLAPTLALAVTSWSWNLLGDRLRDLLDPKAK